MQLSQIEMSDLFVLLGNSDLDYRKIMAEHTDFMAGGKVISKDRIVISEQTHSDHVHVCSEQDCGAGFDGHSQIGNCDAMISNLQNQFLLVRTADCTPVLLHDDKTGCVAAVHSGREGTRKNIVGKTVNALRKEYSCQPSDLKVWIGAGICKAHYEISKNVWIEFSETCKKNGFEVDDDDFPYLDIHNIIFQQLTNSGVRIKNISEDKTCTYESKNYFSYRRDKTRNRQINIIGMIYGKHHLQPLG